VIQKAKCRAKAAPAARAKGIPPLARMGLLKPGRRRRAAKPIRPALITRLKARLLSPEAARASRTRMLPKLMARMPRRRTPATWSPEGRMGAFSHTPPASDHWVRPGANALEPAGILARKEVLW
jgi:hypothetical protein